MSTVTVDLEAAGLAHAKGKSDRCNGEHDIDVLSLVAMDNPEWVCAADLEPLLQALHVQAHPEGTAYWVNCRERACAEISDLMEASRT